MAFSKDVDATISKGETKQIKITPLNKFGTPFSPKKLLLTVELGDTTITKTKSDFEKDGDAFKTQINFNKSGRAYITIKVEDENGNVEKITPNADNSTVAVVSEQR